MQVTQAVAAQVVNSKQLQDHKLLVETENGLRIVQANNRNFFSSKYSVQMVGTAEECKAEKKRLENLTY